ncbi:type II toxin-antitoxin system RelE/ParE family toxin [cyanobacterium endosymbiont of Epithemia turgida]|uniref:type II toxin-antitoxin system RelE/ParE family toxin n=1 Tax=cyanobacterium endosymbiont of Epithemia turgida TaxID=718217 RepID=UPI0004D0E7D5|nr:type II toxin-antitoxin system RelE/ParE family toxin [cyanobacterium endosymbiont of Epithemia turgida]BAP17876.1 plasmid stabilization system [cyanobacterium endosymbiont of Epithemia turgida isolate EtSB Lake Yunoko]
MAYRVIWSSKAIEDVDAIATYIARDSPSYAAAVVRKILDITHRLQECPLTGAIISEGDDSTIRDKLAYTYRVIYRVRDKIVTVAVIVHTKCLLGLANS